MKRRSAIRGTRLVVASNQIDREIVPAPRRVHDYWCADDHRTSVQFAAEVEPPAQWPCRVCGGPATVTRGLAPVCPRPPPLGRTPYEFLMMRRTPADGDRILTAALAAMRRQRGAASNPH